MNHWTRFSRGTSAVLQGDVDEVINMVRRLHGRLSDAACWTRNLQEDTEASREKVTGLIAQVGLYLRVPAIAVLSVPTHQSGDHE